ncbi:MAG: hypothetical protein M1822_001067 [Bathelium mastoideum]|nr:MAG: hypothetical protein M1822_001067 [Bathelium mastoideum]
MSGVPQKRICALIDYEDPYVQPMILAALQSRINPTSYKLVPSVSQQSEDISFLQWRAYESIDFDLALLNPSNHLINSYIIRKALIRKHYLSTTISNWIVKHPDSILKHHFKPAVEFEVDYAEFLDDALTEADAYELRASMEANLERVGEEREWWILKPGMSDRGQGIRLFSTEEQLVSIFEEWEAEQPDSDEEEDQNEDGITAKGGESNYTNGIGIQTESGIATKDRIITSHLRHFIAQPYIHPPLLFPTSTFPPAASRKFHLRTYVLAVGALQVYIYRPILALFAAEPYTAPYASADPNAVLDAHLTNTCRQSSSDATVREDSVHLLWDLPASLLPGQGRANADDWREDVFAQIGAVVGETFEAAARGMGVHFQPIPCAFELFGVDFVVDERGTAWLLEVNAFPDFGQTGEKLKEVVAGLFEEVVEVAVKPFFGSKGSGESGEGQEKMRKVLDVDLGRR